MGNDLDVAHFCRISLRCARARPAVFVEPGFAAAAVLFIFRFSRWCCGACNVVAVDLFRSITLLAAEGTDAHRGGATRRFHFTSTGTVMRCSTTR